jgi:non-ribosomal peptide synthetase component E (peptide arylation enzyme)
MATAASSRWRAGPTPLATDSRPGRGRGAEGDILIIGRDQFAGYLDLELDRAAFTDDGSYRTGDIGRLTRGRIIITDCRKDVIIRVGENLSSKEVQDPRCLHPRVADAAVAAGVHAVIGKPLALVKGAS